MLRRILFMMLLALPLAASPLSAAQLFVNSEGTAQYATIQDALDAAASGDEIVLADGVYTGSGNRRLQFYADVTLSGYSTYSHCVIDCGGSSGDPQYGFALTEETGGTIRNLTVRGAWWTRGAVAHTGWGEYRFESCRFEYNTATDGGGVLSAADGANVTFTDCVFYRNHSDGGGGAVHATLNSTITLDRCSMVLNGAASGACVYATDGATVVAANSLLAWSYAGSAVRDYYSGGFVFTCCDLYGNRGGDWVEGASMASGTGNLNVDPLLLDPMAGSDSLYLSQNSPISEAANSCGRIGALMRVYSPQAIHGIDAAGTGMYATVSDALADLPAGSEIVLEDGTYTGLGVRRLFAYEHSITIRSRSDNPEACVIDPSDEYGAQFLTYYSEGGLSVLRGLTFHSQPEQNFPTEIVHRWSAQDLLIENCRFVDSEFDDSGVILVENGGDFSLIDCEFVGNFSDYSMSEGLIVVRGDETTRTDPVTITTCSFLNNTSVRSGSVMSIESRTVLIDDCLFDGNSAGLLDVFGDGNTAMLSSCDVDLRNSQFSNNICKASGNLLLGDCIGLLENVTFEANETLTSGGGVAVRGGDLVLRQCNFFENISQFSGGGAFADAWPETAPQTVVEFDRCLFLENRSARDGSGFSAQARNAVEPGGTSSDIHVDATLRQCTFHHNESTQGRAQVEAQEAWIWAPARISLSVEYTLITNSNEGKGIDANDIEYLSVTGCNIRGNRGGNYAGQAQPLLAQEGNYSEIPYYCSLDDRYLPVNEVSICNPENNILATQIGVFGVGCYGVTGVDDAPNVVAFDRLQGNYPNPFNPVTTLSFELAQAGPVTLQIHDVKGRLVRVLVAGQMREAGAHSVRWDGRDEANAMAAAGIYFAHMITNEGEQTQKMVLLK